MNEELVLPAGDVVAQKAVPVAQDLANELVRPVAKQWANTAEDAAKVVDNELIQPGAQRVPCLHPLLALLEIMHAAQEA